jgi:uncharacterized repeat protein (TIGR01451 family)
MSRQAGYVLRVAVLPGLVVGAGLTAAVAGAPAASAGASTPWACTAFGYLFQYPAIDSPTSITQVDLATGATSPFGSITDSVNGVGYNTLDNFVYGWDHNTGQLVRVAGDGTLTQLGVPAGMSGADAASGFNTGGFDGSGHLWLLDGGTGAWYEIDLVPGSATYGHVLASGMVAAPATVAHLPQDWAYINGGLYAMVPAASGPAHLVEFSLSTHLFTDLGAVVGVPSGSYGAAYASPGGYLWVSDNTTGNIYRVTVASGTGIAASAGPSSVNNDGARCAGAAIPTITVSSATVAGRLQPADQFTVGLDNSSGSVLTSATTTGTGTTASTTNWPVTEGASYTITDAMAAGSPDPLSDYASSISCTDTTTGATVTPGGSVPNWILPVTGTDSYHCHVTNTPLRPSALVVNSAVPSAVTRAGQLITYSFKVTNTGNTVLNKVSVRDTQEPPAGPPASGPTCPAATLTPGQSETCTATYKVTQADINNGVVKGTATASGTSPNGTEVTSPPSAVKVPVIWHPALTVLMSASSSTLTGVGQRLDFAYKVTNTGSVTMTGIKVRDKQAAPAGQLTSGPACPAATLAPGQSETCTATYKVTAADIANGSVNDTAMAIGDQPSGPAVISAPSQLTVAAPAGPEPVVSGGVPVTG